MKTEPSPNKMDVQIVRQLSYLHSQNMNFLCLLSNIFDYVPHEINRVKSKNNDKITESDSALFDLFNRKALIAQKMCGPSQSEEFFNFMKIVVKQALILYV